MNVSIIGRMPSQHLDDDVFAELWTNATAEGAPVAPHPHLRECAECRLRFASFTSWLEELRTDAVAEANGAIRPERLTAQQAQIFRRLEAAERPGRVIAFPKHPVESHRPMSASRWIAGAAAASFIAGIGLGQLLSFRPMSAVPSTFPADRVVQSGGAAVVPASLSRNSLNSLNEEADLAELEEASIPRYEALRAYDTFTPRAADFVTSSRSPR